MEQTLQILPSSGARRQEAQKRLAFSPVILGESALTLALLTETIYTALPCQRHRLSPGGRALLMEAVIAESGQETFSHLARLAPFPGFVAALAPLWDELKSALVTPAELERAAAALPAGHLRELAQLYGCYQQRLDRLNLFDRHDPALTALNHLQKGGQLPDELERITGVTVRDINDLTPLQLALLLEVARRRPLSFLLPYDPEDPEPYAGALQLLEALERTGEDSPLAAPPGFLPPDGPFLRFLFPRHDQPPPPPSLELMEAATPTDEAHWAGRAIRNLLEQGTPPGTIAVLSRDMGRYAPLLEEICRRYHLPVSTEQGTPLATSPLVHACLAPLYAARDRLSRQSLVELGTSTYLSPHDRRQKHLELDRVLREAGYLDETVGTAEAAISRLISARRTRGQSTEVEEACLAALRPLLAAARRCARAKTLGDALVLVGQHIEEFRIYRHGIGTGSGATVARDASAIVAFQRILSDLTADASLLGMATAPTTPGAVIALLRQSMSGVFLSSRSKDSVTLLSFSEARGMRFDHVFVLGLNEGVCPARHSQHPLLSDADRQALNSYWRHRRLVTSGDRGKEEPLLFRFAVSTAQKSLHLSCAAGDETGSLLLPSEYLEDILSNPALTLRAIGRHPSAPSLAGCADQMELLSSLLSAQAMATPPLAPLLKRICSIGQRERERFTNPGAAACSADNPVFGLLARADILSDLRQHFSAPPGNHFTPTLLEEYGRCPFRFFLHRLAGIIPPQELTLDLAPVDRGTLLHALLQACFERAGKDGLLPLTGAPAEEALLRDLADAVFLRWEATHPLPPPLWQAEKLRALALAASVLHAEARDASPLIPAALEHRFAPLVLETPDGDSITLTGVMDRIDRSLDGSRIRVVDYKLSKDKGRYARLLKREEMGVRSFQMPIYAAAAAGEFGQDREAPCKEVSVRYWVVRGGGWEETLLPLGGAEGAFLDSSSEAMIRGGQDNFFWRVWQMVVRMKEGNFPATPSECGYCPFAAICRLGD